MAEKALRRCVIVCASPDADCDFVAENISSDDYVIAADGGMETLRKANITPDLFVGDFDSYKGEIPENVEVIKLNTHKDDTDSMHCACVALERGFRDICLLGAVGGRPSHTYSNYAVLSFLADNGVTAEILGERESVRVLNEGDYPFNNLSGREFSLFPFGCESVAVTYFGDVEYPASNLIVARGSSLGKSNVFKSDSCNIRISRGKAIVFVEITKL